MKNYLLITLLAFLTFSVNAQDTNSDSEQRSNEIKINGLYTVIGAFDITYERLLNEEGGLGLNIFIPFDEDIKDDINYYISPYYRIYFGKKHAAGFFVEGFGLLSSTKTDDIILIDAPAIEGETYTDFALGIGVGGKWVTNRGLLGEIGFGVGRNLFNSNNTGDEFVGKVGITLGYRF